MDSQRRDRVQPEAVEFGMRRGMYASQKGSPENRVPAQLV